MMSNSFGSDICRAQEDNSRCAAGALPSSGFRTGCCGFIYNCLGLLLASGGNHDL